MTESETEVQIKQFPCGQCGAKLRFRPGTTSLTCEYCQHENPIPQSEEDIQELDYRETLSRLADSEEMVETRLIQCKSCGARTSLEANETASQCPFCDSDVVAVEEKRLIRPRSLLPFEISREKARAGFKKWIAGRWFAPNRLKTYARTESKLNGLYVPYWTYDSNTTSWYTGQRGENYYVTETYQEDGKTKTRQVQKIRWYSVSGVVWNTFDDLLVLASKSLPEKYADRLEPWDLGQLESYRQEYLSGFRSESYQVDLEGGFEVAKSKMEGPIRSSIHRDIGGDHQRISSVRTQYDKVTFKHVLLPVWLSAYRYKEKVYRFLINGRTGEVQGERPWSWVKIVGLILAVLVLAGAIALLVSSRGEGGEGDRNLPLELSDP